MGRMGVGRVHTESLNLAPVPHCSFSGKSEFSREDLENV